MGIAIKARMIGYVLILATIPYFGFLLANISKTNESAGILAGAMLAISIILITGSMPYLNA